jgi:hypothetical protein
VKFQKGFGICERHDLTRTTSLELEPREDLEWRRTELENILQRQTAS